MSSEVAIRIKNLTKKYTLQHSKKYANGTHTHDHWALNDVSFDIKKGESVGIIGPNGSGKSTLLKILSGVTKPTSGSVEISGKVASILDIGAGFHTELSGRENVFLNGQLLGFSKKEIKEKYSKIVEFSGIGNFIEEPVKTYSNGMYLRLAFSILAHLDFDIYLFDEVMSVGDASFQIKVKEFLQKKNKQDQATFLFVSHQLAEIQSICSSIYLLDETGISKDESNNSIEKYLSATLDKSETNLPINERIINVGELSENEFFQIKKIYIKSNDSVIQETDLLIFYSEIEIKKECDFDISFGVENLLGAELFYVSTLVCEQPFVKNETLPKSIVVKTQIPPFTLKKAKYTLTITLMANKKTIISRFKSCYFQVVNDKKINNDLLTARSSFVIVRGDWTISTNTAYQK